MILLEPHTAVSLMTYVIFKPSSCSVPVLGFANKIVMPMMRSILPGLVPASETGTISNYNHIRQFLCVKKTIMHLVMSYHVDEIESSFSPNFTTYVSIIALIDIFIIICLKSFCRCFICWHRIDRKIKWLNWQYRP